MPTGKQCCGFVLMVFAVVLIAGGQCLYHLLPPYVHKMIKEELPVTDPGSSGFETFFNSSSKVSIYQSFYVFHCLNPYDVVNFGAAPKLQQLGPYQYLTTQWRNPENITWYANGTVSYTYHETYEFQPELSGTLNAYTDVITTLNLGLIGAIYENRNDPLLVDAIKALAENFDIFVNVTVDELLFGYNNTFLESIAWIVKKNPLVSLFTQDDPSTWRNGSTAMYTGGKVLQTPHIPQPPPNSMNFLTMWEGWTELPFWNSTYANMINGTDGTVLSPGITSADRPHVFVDTLYRSATLAYNQDVEYEGVDLLRFVLSPEITLNGTANPDNEAFFMTETGFLPTPPAGNAPMTFSKPHYLDANLDRVLVQIQAPYNVIDRDSYETFLDTEPNTGVLFRVHKRIQLNTFIESTYNTGFRPPLLATWFPLLWADENMELPTDLVNDFKKEVQLPLLLAKWGGIAATALGGLLAFIGLIVVVACRVKKADLHHSNYSSLSTDQQLNMEQ